MKMLAITLTPLLLFASACDGSDSGPADEVDDRTVETSNVHGEMMLGFVCAQIDCTTDQKEELSQIVKTAIADGPTRSERQEMHAKFAAAFRADTLDTDALQKLHDERIAGRKHVRNAVLEAHAVLSAEQRDELADMVQEFEPPHRGMADRMAKHMASRLCDVVTCEGDQKQQITAALTDAAPKPDKDAINQAKKLVTDAIRSDDLDADDVDAVVDQLRAQHQAQGPQMLTVLSEVHTILTPKQRDAVATKVEAGSPDGFLGGWGSHGG